jgi:hypothetical protein
MEDPQDEEKKDTNVRPGTESESLEPVTPEEIQLRKELDAGEWDEAQYFERLFEIKKLEQENRSVEVRRALNKFNVFLHLTAYISGVAYFLLLGVLYRPALPYVFIPIGLWTIGICYHAYRAFLSKKPPREKRKKKSEEDEADEEQAAGEDASESPHDEEGTKGRQ